MRRGAAALVAAAALVVAAAASADGPRVGRAGARAPLVEQMVVFRSGRAKIAKVRARGLTVRAGGTRCPVRTGTPLAALVRARPGRIRLRDDFGSCPRDGSGLYVLAIGRDRERGQGGWVYKVGRREASAGAANPTGPFGRGLLRHAQRVLWFYCRRSGACQRTLAARASVQAGGLVRVRVTGYDGEGRGVPVAGATVMLGSLRLQTGGDGVARASVASGTYTVRAEKRGLVRSFDERVVVR